MRLVYTSLRSLRSRSLFMKIRGLRTCLWEECSAFISARWCLNKSSNINQVLFLRPATRQLNTFDYIDRLRCGSHHFQISTTANLSLMNALRIVLADFSKSVEVGTYFSSSVNAKLKEVDNLYANAYNWIAGIPTTYLYPYLVTGIPHTVCSQTELRFAISSDKLSYLFSSDDKVQTLSPISPCYFI